MNSPTIGRCCYCGEQKNNPNEVGCCPEHTRKAEKIIEERLNNNLCSQCGTPRFVDAEGEEWAVCYKCLIQNSNIMKSIGIMFKKIKEDRF